MAYLPEREPFFEDCLQIEYAKSFGANYIVARNVADIRELTHKQVRHQTEIFVLEPKCLKLESIGIATVDCISQNYNYQYEIRQSDDGVKYDFYLSNKEIEDTSIITNEDMQTIIYKKLRNTM